MTNEEVFVRSLEIIRLVSDLKDDIGASRFGVQSDFDAGMLEAVSAILECNLDKAVNSDEDIDDPRWIAEKERQLSRRLMRAINSAGTR